MQIVKHKMFGVGEVISVEDREIGAYITVRFKNGKEMRLAIPESFEIGVVTAVGDFNDDVQAAIAVKRACEQKRLGERRAALESSATAAQSFRHRRGPKGFGAVKDVIETDYEAYLIRAGYETETPSGHPSTVYAYSAAIERNVLETEHITWEGLRADIDNVVNRYDVGGPKEHIGAKSNSTVINALKRFQEFVND